MLDLEGKISKKLNSRRGDSDLVLEQTVITPGNSTPNISRIKSPEEFFQRSGTRAGNDKKAGEPYNPSGSITVNPDGSIRILPPGGNHENFY